MDFKQKLSWKFLLPIGVVLWSSFAWSYLSESFIGFLALIGFLMTLAGVIDLTRECRKNTKNIPLLVLFILIFLILFIVPWMTDNWCKQRLIGYKFNGYGSVDESWSVSTEWIPFGRNVGVWLPKEEQPQKPKDFPEGEIYFPPPGGYGFMVFMNFFGNIIGKPSGH